MQVTVHRSKGFQFALFDDLESGMRLKFHPSLCHLLESDASIES